MSSQKASSAEKSKEESLIDPKLLEQNNPGSFEDLHKKTKGMTTLSLLVVSVGWPIWTLIFFRCLSGHLRGLPIHAQQNAEFALPNQSFRQSELGDAFELQIRCHFRRSQSDFTPRGPLHFIFHLEKFDSGNWKLIFVIFCEFQTYPILLGDVDSSGNLNANQIKSNQIK